MYQGLTRCLTFKSSFNRQLPKVGNMFVRQMIKKIRDISNLNCPRTQLVMGRARI